MKKPDELQKENQRLKEQNQHLEAKLKLLGAGAKQSMFSIPQKLKNIPLSISGLESMYLQVDKTENIVNVNSNMADLIGKSKNEIIGKSLEEVDVIPWAKGIFKTLLNESTLISDEIEFETSYIDTISGRERSLKLKASYSGDVGNVTANDTTNFKRIMNTFERYVNPTVIRKMQNSTEDFFKTERLNMTVLFADLRGFTSISSDLDVDEVKDTLNEYHSAMIHVIDQYEATVDKIIGDEVMALFGAPIFYNDHAYRSIKVATEMQLAHQRLLDKWKSEKRPTPPVGVGINTGEMVVGNIGCDTRMDYTVIGHHVNLAARLCGAAEGGEILVSMNTVNELSDYVKSNPEKMREKINFKKAGTINIKGLKEPAQIAKVMY